MAHALEVTPSGFYAHQQKPDRPRRQRDQTLLQKMQPIFQESRRTYGSPRLHAALRRAGERCGKNRVARIMRENKMKARQKRRFIPRTTQSDHDHPIAPNWLAQVPAAGPARSSLGGGHHLHRNGGRLDLSGRHSRCLFAQSRWLGDGNLIGNYFGDSSLEPGAKRTSSGSGAFASFGSRSSVCQRRVSGFTGHV